MNNDIEKAENSRAKLLVVADLGRLKAYRLELNPLNYRPRAELLEEWDTSVVQHLSEEVTDQAGQFRKGASASEGPGTPSDGEQHNLDLQRRRRAAKALAGRIDELLESEDVDGCYLAADARINPTILSEMAERTRAKVEKNVTANLSKASVEEVIKHFCE